MTSETRSTVHIENPEQAAAWDGDEGRHWAEHTDSYERANSRYARRLLEDAQIEETDAVLDVGCGAGKTTRDAARLAARGSATGIDLSSAMLDHARERSRADGLAHVTFVQGDAQVYPFDEHTFDIAISSFGVMFFNDPVAALSNVGRALRPGGRVALMVWRELARNEWVTEVRAAVALGRRLPEPPPDVPSPFAWAEPDRVRTILASAGFDRIDVTAVDDDVDLGATADDAYDFLRTLGIVNGVIRDLEDAERVEALAQLRNTVDAHATADGVLFGSSSWLVTARRP